jgi:hypothetical protein
VAHLLHEVGVHDDEQAEERDGAGEVEVLEREADPRGEQLGQHPRQARVHPQERLLRIHPPAAPATPRRPPPNPKQGRARAFLHLPSKEGSFDSLGIRDYSGLEAGADRREAAGRPLKSGAGEFGFRGLGI